VGCLKGKEKGVKRARLPKKLILLFLALIFGLLVRALNPPLPEFQDKIANRTFARASDLFYNFEVTRYPSSAEITEFKPSETTVGIDADTSKLNFGIIPQGGSFSRRTINLTSLGKDARISVRAYGEIQPYVSFSQNDFIIRKDKKAVVEAVFDTKKNNKFAEIANYTGEIDITVQTPKFDFLYALWGSQ